MVLVQTSKMIFFEKAVSEGKEIHSLFLFIIVIIYREDGLMS